MRYLILHLFLKIRGDSLFLFGSTKNHFPEEIYFPEEIQVITDQQESLSLETLLNYGFLSSLYEGPYSDQAIKKYFLNKFLHNDDLKTQVLKRIFEKSEHYERSGVILGFLEVIGSISNNGDQSELLGSLISKVSLRGYWMNQF